MFIESKTIKEAKGWFLFIIFLNWESMWTKCITEYEYGRHMLHHKLPRDIKCTDLPG